MTKIDRTDGKIRLAILLLSGAVFSVLAFRGLFPGPEPGGDSPPPVIVQVSGNVAHPGVYLLERGRTSAAEALAAAGAKLDLPPRAASQALQSGQRLTLVCGDAGQEILTTRMDAATLLASGHKLDANSASESDLCLIPQMRPEMAAAIVQRRRDEPWKDIMELQEVQGIGPKTLVKLRDYIVVIPPVQPSGSPPN
ncbi:MAG: helix-hairpin-helix domain-containing protein [Desulfobacteraceae bacterium]|nr:helix-hairpin-helix domain-containing protein [Desulfobacteraceae bacterium]